MFGFLNFGRLFVPPALDGKNLNTDPEVLMWTEKYARALVARLRDIKNIVMWDLGNECNCLERVKTRAEAYVWTATVRNAILSADNTRPISSGMHSLVCDNDSGVWQLCDQGELCDFVTMHPYPSAAVNGDIEPYNELRMTITPTAQSEYSAGVSKKPCIIQESGTFSPMLGNERMSADFLRVNVLSAFANNLGGFLWWCGMEHFIATETCCGFDPEKSEEFYRIYKEFGKNIAESYDVKCDNPYIGITELDSDSGKIFCAINYSEKQQKFDVENKDDFKILYGALGDVPPCDGVILQKK